MRNWSEDQLQQYSFISWLAYYPCSSGIIGCLPGALHAYLESFACIKVFHVFTFTLSKMKNVHNIVLYKNEMKSSINRKNILCLRWSRCWWEARKKKIMYTNYFTNYNRYVHIHFYVMIVLAFLFQRRDMKMKLCWVFER